MAALRCAPMWWLARALAAGLRPPVPGSRVLRLPPREFLTGEIISSIYEADKGHLDTRYQDDVRGEDCGRLATRMHLSDAKCGLDRVGFVNSPRDALFVQP